MLAIYEICIMQASILVFLPSFMLHFWISQGSFKQITAN